MSLAFGQNAIVGSGFSSGWGGGGCPTGNGNFKFFAASAGTSYGVTTTANGTGNQYFRLGVDWSVTSQLTITPGSDVNVTPNTTYNLNTGCTTSGAMFYNVPNATYNYVFKTLNAGTTPTGTFVFFEVQGAVQSVSSVTQSPAASAVAVNQSVTVTANLSGALNTGQAVYIRYTTNAYSTSTVAQMTGSGTTYTATIPGNAASSNVSYYVFTSGTANVATNGSNADLYTINLNNNGGSNYAYAVSTNSIGVVSSGGTTSATYATLKGAFDAINVGTHTGTISILIGENTTETATAVLNASAGAASYTSINITPTGGGARTISGAIAAGSPLIDLNGADNITINGLNTGGNSLTISNTTASGTSATSTIRFIGGATNNTITNCSVLGSFSAAVTTNGGNIFFSTDGATANGNDNNTISNCNIGPAGSNSPTKTIFGNGSTTTTAIGNSGITISNNNIYDYFGAAVSSAGIYLSTGNTDWTISNNKFYQSTTKTQTNAAQHSAIWIANTSGNNFLVSGNTIGYANSGGTGTYTFVGVGASSVLVPIFLNVGTTTATSVQGNTIAGIAMSGAVSGTSSSAAFRGIYVSGGLATIGDVTGNTIGSMSSTGSISFTSSATLASDVIGIFNFGTSNWTTNNNLIGGITAANTSTGAANIYGIRCNTGSGVTWTCNNNTVGGTVANSMQSTSTATGTIVNGILNSNPIGTFSGNTIRNLTTAGGTGTTTTASVVGIVIVSTANQTISQNTIFNLSNTNTSAATTVTGIQMNGSTANTVERNNIYGLTSATSSATAEVNGIRVAGGTTTYRNNMIAIGAGINNAIIVNGINEPLGTDNFFHNSVYIGGSPTAGSVNSFAFNSTQTVNTRSFRDNIFVNARSNSGATGKNYAVQVGGTTANPLGLTINNNIYFITGTGTVFGRFNALDIANLAGWKTAVGQDAASFQTDPQYNAPTAATPDLHIHATNATAAEANGVDVGVTNDIDGQTRSGLTPVDIGADAGNFVGLDLLSPVITYTPLAATCGAGDASLTATITDASGVPTTGGDMPRIYYRKVTLGVPGSWVSQPGTLASGTATNGTWTFPILQSDMGGLTAGTDVVNYYVIAQDIANNVGSSPSAGLVATNVNTVTNAPTTPSSYAVLATIAAGTYQIGASQAFPYNTLENAVSSFNSACLAGPVVMELIDATYTLATPPLSLNANVGSSSTNTVTIHPASGVNVNITGSSTGGLFVLNGADYITLDGTNTPTTNTVCPSVSATRNLTLTNTNAGTSSAVVWLQTTAGADAATNNRIMNCNLVGNSNTTTLFGIGSGSTTIGTASLGNGNNGNAFINNNISKTQYGIYSAGLSVASKNTGTIINQNQINGIGVIANAPSVAGILTTNESGITISGNTIGNISGSGTKYGISLGATSFNSFAPGVSNAIINATITNNSIISITNTASSSAFGILLCPATSGNSLIANNMIAGISSAATPSDFTAGMYVGGGTGSTTNIYYNTVYLSGTSTRTTNAFALAIGGTDPIVDIRNNILVNTLTGGTGGNSYAIGLAYSTYTNLTSNNNDFVVTAPDATNKFYIGGVGSLSAATNQLALTNWQTTTAKDAASLNVLPTFTSATNLRLVPSSNGALNNLGTAVSVTTDIDCATRGASPDMGVSEFTPPTIDMGLSALLAPTTGNCFGASESVTATIKNYSALAAIDFSVNPVTVTVNVTGAATQTFSTTINSGTLAIGATQNVVLGTLDMSVAGAYTFNGNTSVTGDGNSANDALSPAITRTSSAIAVGTVSASTTSICVSGTTALTLAGSTAGATIQWESSLDNFATAPTSVGTNSTTYTSGTLTSGPVYYRAQVTCGAQAGTTSVTTVNVNNPSVGTPSATAVCGAGTTTLSTTGSSGTVKWYDAVTGGNLLSTTTPTISAATTYYIEANNPAPNSLIVMGSGATTSSTAPISPFNGTYGGMKSQYLYTAAQLQSAGLQAGNITALAFNITSVGATLSGFAVEMGNTALTQFSSGNIQGGLTTVRNSATFTPVNGLNNLTFNTPFNWDGTSNIIVSVSWSNNNTSNNSTTIQADVVVGGFNVSQSYNKDSETAANMFAFTGSTGSGTSTFNVSATRPRITFTGVGTCATPRTAVVVPYTTPPTIGTIAATPSTICLGSSTTLSLTGTDPSYTSLTWNNGAGSGASVSVSPTTTTTYTVTATDGLCTTTANTAVTVNPVPTGVTASVNNATICNGESVNLSSAFNAQSSTVFTESFSSGVGNWSVTTASSSANQNWANQANGYVYGTTPVTFSGSTGNFMMANSDIGGTGSTANTRLISPSFSTMGYSGMTLQFKEYYNADNDLANVEISDDDFTTSTVLITRNSSNTTDIGSATTFATTSIAIPVAFQNKPSVKIRFRFEGGYDWYWAVDEVNITGTPTPYTYAWTNTSGTTFSSTNQNPTGVAPTANTNYQVEVTNYFNCKATASTSVTVNPLPTASTASITLCESAAGSGTASFDLTSVENTVTASAPNTSVAWYSNVGLTTAISTPTTYTSASTSTTVYAKVTNTITSCTNSAAVTLTVNTLPAVTGGTITPACNQTSVDLSSAVTTSATIDGYYSDASLMTSVSTSTAVTLAGTYYVKVSNGGTPNCTNSAAIIVGNFRNSTTASTSQTACNSYTWNGTTYTTSGVYTFASTNVAGCVHTDTLRLTINASPVVGITGLSSAYCKDAGSITLTGSPVGVGGTFKVDGTVATTFNPSTASVGAHSIKFIYVNAFTCSDSVTQSVTVNDLPTVSIVGVNAAYCEDASPVALNGNPSGLGSFTIDGTTETILTPSLLTAGSHNVVFTYNDGNCTNTATQSVMINALPTAPTISTSGATTFCSGGSVTLTSSYTGGNVWSNSANSDAISVSTSADYTVTYTDANSCSSTSLPTTVSSLSTTGATVPTVFGDYFATHSCVDGAWTYFYANNKLLLGLEMGSWSPGTLVQTTPGAGQYAVRVDVGSGMTKNLTNADYNTSGKAWEVVNRTWDVMLDTIAQEPVTPINVRTYFTEAEYQAVNATLNGTDKLDSAANMTVYKLRRTTPIWADSVDASATTYDYSMQALDAEHVGLDSFNLVLYNNQSPYLAHWIHTNNSPYAGVHRAEISVTEFSGGGGGGGAGGGSPFPIELAYFNGHNEGTFNVLNWATLTELSNKSFELQRSIDGLSYQTIGTINSKAPNGSSNQALTYDFVDKTPAKTSYYRLKQLDIDGKMNILPQVVEISLSSNFKTAMNLFPNPTTSELNVVVTGIEQDIYHIEIFDIYGKLISSVEKIAGTGTTLVNMNVSNLAQGTYMVTVKDRTNNLVATQRFVKE